jgi:spermidine synthase
MYRIFVLYALSGFVSLGYQVSWFRIFNDWFGSTTMTFALVVCNFIGGLGLGAFYSRPISEWIGARCGLDDRIRVYGVVEVLVGVAVLLTVLLQPLQAGLWGDFPYIQTAEGFWRPSLAMSAFQTGAALICVLIPCIFMGVTFPLICHAFVNTSKSERFPSSLYAWNTLGACTGVLACQYLLIPELGHGPTYWLMAGINLLLGGYFWVSGGADPALHAKPVAQTATQLDPISTGFSASALITFAMLSGLVAGALEGDMFKRIGFSLGRSAAAMSFISFWAILGIFLASATIRKFAWKRIAPFKAAFVAALLYYVVISRLQTMDALRDWIHLNVLPVSVPAYLPFGFIGSIAFPNNPTQLLVFIGVIVLPPFYLVSLLLPYVCNRAQIQGHHLGRLYGLNTLAFCIGLVGFALLAPQLNIFYSTKLFFALFLLATLQLCVLTEAKAVPAWQPLGFAALFAAGCFLVPADFDRSYFRPVSPSATQRISALKSDGNVTTYVVTTPGMRVLYFGRVVMTGTNRRAQSYMRLMAHFPLLAQNEPKKALLICFGIGNTASAIAAHDSIEAIDIVDLNENVFRTAPEFEQWNERVFADSRARLINDDGRHFLRVTAGRYDLITSEPPPPMSDGVYRLYSREYYQDALDHLTPNGMMSQWLPIYQMPKEAVEQAVHTFTEVFQHTLLFSGWANDFILVGSPSPIDLGVLEENFAALPEHTARALRRVGVNDAISLLGRIVDSDAGLRTGYRAGRTISDQHNDLEHLLLSPQARDGMLYRPAEVYEELGMASLQSGPELRAIMFHLGRLRYHVGGFPYESLATVARSDGIELAGIDWLQVRRLHESSSHAYGSREFDRANHLLRQGLALGAEQPQLLIELARLQRSQRDLRRAEKSLMEFVRLEPHDTDGRYLLGLTLRDRGNGLAALRMFETVTQLAPNLPKPLGDIAWILATHPDEAIRDPLRAVAVGRRAVELAEGKEASMLDTLAAAYAAAGDFEEARKAAKAAIDATRASGLSSIAIEERLAGYEADQAFIDWGLDQG